MSLDYQLTDIPDYKAVCFVEEKMRGTTECIIFGTMAAGIGATAEHPDEFVWRVMFYEQLNGALGMGPDGPIPLPEEEIRKHIGLRTNVAYEPRHEWLSRIANIHARHSVPAAMVDNLDLDLDLDDLGWEYHNTRGEYPRYIPEIAERYVAAMEAALGITEFAH